MKTFVLASTLGVDDADVDAKLNGSLEMISKVCAIAFDNDDGEAQPAKLNRASHLVDRKASEISQLADGSAGSEIRRDDLLFILEQSKALVSSMLGEALPDLLDLSAEEGTLSNRLHAITHTIFAPRLVRNLFAVSAERLSESHEKCIHYEWAKRAFDLRSFDEVGISERLDIVRRILTDDTSTNEHSPKELEIEAVIATLAVWLPQIRDSKRLLGKLTLIATESSALFMEQRMLLKIPDFSQKPDVSIEDFKAADNAAFSAFKETYGDSVIAQLVRGLSGSMAFRSRSYTNSRLESDFAELRTGRVPVEKRLVESLLQRDSPEVAMSDSFSALLDMLIEAKDMLVCPKGLQDWGKVISEIAGQPEHEEKARLILAEFADKDGQLAKLTGIYSVEGLSARIKVLEHFISRRLTDPNGFSRLNVAIIGNIAMWNAALRKMPPTPAVDEMIKDVRSLIFRQSWMMIHLLDGADRPKFGYQPAKSLAPQVNAFTKMAANKSLDWLRGEFYTKEEAEAARKLQLYVAVLEGLKQTSSSIDFADLLAIEGLIFQ